MSRLQCKIALFILLLLQAACGPSRLSHQDLSRQLASPGKRLQPGCSVYHTRDSSYLFFSLRTSDLLYKNSDSLFRADVSLHYEVFPSWESNAVLDSATFSFQPVQDTLDVYLNAAIPLRLPAGEKFLLRVNVTDNLLRESTQRIVTINRSPAFLQQQFYIAGSNEQPLFRNHVRPGEVFYLHSGNFGTTSLLVRCYFRNFPHPAPPFSKIPDPRFSFRPDSLFSISAGSKLSLNQPGIYHFQPDTASRAGFTVFVFDNWFPEIRSPQQMLEPLRYLTTRKEFAELLKEGVPKAAADRFWLRLGGRPDRAKGLIRIYYQRVQEANRQFTSYVPGWKTDRGMVYTVLGPPTSVYRNGGQEEWTYNRGTAGTTTFDFRPTGNPFSDNDYSLIRSEMLEYPWYEAVEQWRQGNISLRH